MLSGLVKVAIRGEFMPQSQRYKRFSQMVWLSAIKTGSHPGLKKSFTDRVRAYSKGENMFQINLSKASLVIATGVITLALSGCWDDSGDNASAGAKPLNQATFGASMEDKPCEIVTGEMIVAAFGVPADALEQSSYTSANCSYDWEGEERGLSVLIHVNGVHESSQDASDYFQDLTRSMSKAEADDAMATIRAQAEKTGDAETPQEREAADAASNEIASGGLQFVDVGNVADEARFATQSGELIVRKDNLVFTVSAYHGANMPLPATLNAESIMNASKDWLQETLPQRKEAAVKLAKAAANALR